MVKLSVYRGSMSVQCFFLLSLCHYVTMSGSVPPTKCFVLTATFDFLVDLVALG